jgi:hypothetical protein
LPVTVVAVALMTACTPAGGPVTSEAEAVALVLDQAPQFADLAPQDPNLIGQAGWYQATEVADGWQVVVRIGWGDCPAGCISEHVWTYQVQTDGTVRLVSETGDPFPATSSLSGVVTAGPTCPVVTNPPDPSCADRPVDGAVIVIEGPDGTEVARGTSDAQGRFQVDLAPGDYRLVPQDVDGLMGTAAPLEVTLTLGEPTEVTISYDTGIR